MTTVQGQYVKTFAEASHALVADMHMDADYPFKMPRIVGVVDGVVTIEERGVRAEFPVIAAPHGEYGYITQSSSFERMFKRSPQRFSVHPFKDIATPAAPPGAPTL